MSRPVHVRHVVDGVASAPGATPVLGRYFVPQDTAGVNGRNGYQSGQDNGKLREEADFTIVFPNDAGDDRIKHLDRFLILATRADPGRDYKYGDEWLEIYEGDPPGGDLLRVGTPIDATFNRTTIELHCMDALKTLEHARETAAGLAWCAAPRDVIEHYTQVWQAALADDFADLSPFGGNYNASTLVTDALGRWEYQQIAPAVGGLRLAENNASLRTHQTYPIGLASAEPHTHWRIEARFARFSSVAGAVTLWFDDGASPGGFTAPMYLAFSSNPASTVGQAVQVGIDGVATTVKVSYAGTGAIELAVEFRGRWAYFYFNGELVAVKPVQALGDDTLIGLTVNGASGIWADLDYVLARRTRPYLLRGTDKGDYRLPGAPPASGLVGSYFNENDKQHFGQAEFLSPLVAPYARRLDPAINFPEIIATDPTWQPSGPPSGRFFSARWTGAIQLDDPSSWTFRLTYQDGVRLWIGATRFGDQIIDDWAGASPSSTSAPLSSLGTQPGWYPIILEYQHKISSGGVVLEASKNGGPWVVPGTEGAPALSPLGIFEDHVRGESHATMVKQLMDTFGYQYLCEPKQLESGEFPGRVAPRVRVGRDYDLTLTEDEDTDLQATVTAEDAVDVLMADAQGLADPTQGTQLSAEMFNFPGLDKHLLMHQEAESLSDIANPELLLQRLSSLLGLRSAPFEQVSATVVTEGGERKLVPIALTGSLAEIAWQPGDGIKRSYPILGVEDAGYTQMTVVSRKFVPDALGLPAVSFRPRTRTFRDFLERMQRAAIAPQRYYQGQLATVQGTDALATFDPTGTPQYVYGDTSRAPLPTNIESVKKAEVVVRTKTSTTPWDLAVNGTVVRSNLAVPGRYDVTPWVAPAASGGLEMQASLQEPAVGGGGFVHETVGYVLELQVAI